MSPKQPSAKPALPKALLSDSGRPEETAPLTERQYQFIVEFYHGRKRCVFVDPKRGYRRVAVAYPGTEIAADYRRLDGFLRKAARHVLMRYAAQYAEGERLAEVEFLEGVALSEKELAEGVGRPGLSRQTLLKHRRAAEAGSPKRR